MATITRFEDIEGWRRARELARSIYLLSADGSFSRDYAFRDQVRRAAVSIMANVAEGFGRGGNREFIQFLGHARGSCAELKSHLYLARDANYISEENFASLYKLAAEIEKLISGLMRYLNGTDHRGAKFKSTVNSTPRVTRTEPQEPRAEL